VYSDGIGETKKGILVNKRDAYEEETIPSTVADGGIVVCYGSPGLLVDYM
jgi:hypothetical protein